MKFKKIVTLFVFLLCISLMRSQAQQTVQHTVYFTTGNYQISTTEEQTLKKIVDSASRLFESYQVRIKGKTDNTGSDAFNYTLSQKRAMTVEALFKAAGITTENIATDFEGEASPDADNETEEGRRLNRRADITIIPIVSSTAFQKPIAPAQDSLPEGDINELYSLLKTPAQEYCIDLARDTFLVGNKGTIIHYKANTIKRANLSCKCFTLNLNEYFDNSELIINNLTTTSDGQLLESGGMIKLDGYCDGKKYELKPGEFFTVMVPSDTILAGMKLLSANRDNDSDYLNWKLDPDYPDLDNFDLNRMLLLCGGNRSDISSTTCHFFFCKIGRFFSRLFGDKNYLSKKDKQVNQLVENEKKVFDKYELEGEDLAIALRKSKDNAGVNALKYYVYKNANWDYRNIDRLKRFEKFTNFIVENKPVSGSDVKLVFKSSKTVVPAIEKTSSYIFKQVPDGVAIWVVGLRFTASKEIYLGLKEINTSDKKITLDFKLVSVEELKAFMEKVNKRG